MSETQKISATLNEDTVKWLEETYPDSLSNQEAIRMAISDARTLREHRDVFLVDRDDS
jgi:ABC-type nitrate/sulfonate/bicarbonate transport system ATPase subunit